MESVTCPVLSEALWQACRLKSRKMSIKPFKIRIFILFGLILVSPRKTPSD